MAHGHLTRKQIVQTFVAFSTGLMAVEQTFGRWRFVMIFLLAGAAAISWRD